MKSSIAVVDIDVRIAIRELYDEMLVCFLVCFTVKLICFNLKVSWRFDLCWFLLEFYEFTIQICGKAR